MALSLVRRVGAVRNLAPFLASRKYADSATGGGLSLTFGSPTTSFFNNTVVTQVDVPSFSGNFSILPQHVPIIAVLRPGVVTIMTDSGDEKFVVSSGTVTVNVDSSAQILAEEAAPLANFDLTNTQSSLSAANAALSAATDEMGKASAQIEVDA